VSVDLPDGVSFDHYVILLPEAVIVAAVNADGALVDMATDFEKVSDKLDINEATEVRWIPLDGGCRADQERRYRRCSIRGRDRSHHRP
jgi:hypothetical protein